MMKNLKYIVCMVVIFVLAGCSQGMEAANHKNQSNHASTSVAEDQANKDEIYASVGGKKITKEQMDYECFRAELQAALANNPSQNSCPQEKTIISQIVELKAIDYLAEEKKVKATDEEVQQRITKVKKDLEPSPIYQEKIASFGEEKFWKFEKARYYTIINAEKIKESLMDEEKNKHSYYDDESLKLTAKKEFDDLIVEAVGLVEPTIFYY